MQSEKQLKLVQSIDRKSIENKINWTRTASDSIFQAPIAGFVVRVIETEDFNNSDFSIEIRDDNGELIDEISATSLADSFPGCGSFSMMRNIITLARRKTRGSDAALDKIIGELDDAW